VTEKSGGQTSFLDPPLQKVGVNWPTPLTPCFHGPWRFDSNGNFRFAGL